MVDRPYPFQPSSPNGWGVNLLAAIKALRTINKLNLSDELDFMASIFNFEEWNEWREWLKINKVDFTMVKGPHAITILKAIAAKHGRENLT